MEAFVYHGQCSNTDNIDKFLAEVRSKYPDLIISISKREPEIHTRKLALYGRFWKR